ncbi:hypothetical protein I2I11_00400 [Pontibacter sp. 172403-2]|uniref:hypothetical protein n=1 Tax=Pontibacter rufus TaxID=2791028 RepID=UPI0018AF9BF1|nr:hypothetical protein [Pontibacter sp. 172403-2]MBF9251742.1 hypothetical protein [Pontibacter sp. 172403-2]
MESQQLSGTKKKQFLKVETAGKSPELLSSLKEKMLQAIHSFLDITIDGVDNKTIREEAKEFSHALLKYGKDKLEKAGFENDKIRTEIDFLYSQKEKEFAEARKLNAEARKAEFENAISQLQLSLKITRVMLISESGEEALVLVKDVEQFIEILDDFKYP